MVTALQFTTKTNTLNSSATDIQRIARSLKRALIISRYSRGSIKRSSMAMINMYIRLAGHNFANSPRDLHAVM